MAGGDQRGGGVDRDPGECARVGGQHPQRHLAPVAVTDEVHPAALDAEVGDGVGDHRLDEGDVVAAGRAGRSAAALPGVPALSEPGRVDEDRPPLAGQVGETVAAFLERGRGIRAVQHDIQRQARRAAARGDHQLAPPPTPHPQVPGPRPGTGRDGGPDRDEHGRGHAGHGGGQREGEAPTPAAGAPRHRAPIAVGGGIRQRGDAGGAQRGPGGHLRRSSYVHRSGGRGRSPGPPPPRA